MNQITDLGHAVRVGISLNKHGDHLRLVSNHSQVQWGLENEKKFIRLLTKVTSFHRGFKVLDINCGFFFFIFFSVLPVYACFPHQSSVKDFHASVAPTGQAPCLGRFYRLQHGGT